MSREGWNLSEQKPELMHQGIVGNEEQIQITLLTIYLRRTK